MADAERTEKPTHKRRERATEEGKFAYSSELTGAITLTVSLLVLSATLGSGANFRSLLSTLLQAATTGEVKPEQLVDMVRTAGYFFLMTSAPIFAAAAAASLAGSVIQGLPMFGGNVTGLKWEHLNPMTGLAKLKGKISPMEWAKILLLITICSLALRSTLSQFWQQLITLPAADISASNQILHSAINKLVTYIVGTAVVLGVGDFFWQRRRFEESLKMSKEEVKEDMKSVEGNPKIKQKIRAMQREMARHRMMSRIKDATVIVTNPTHFAVALEYKPETMAAPRVVAKGQDLIAQKIKEVGREYDIPTVENVPLARALYKSVELEQEVPLELYKAVAEVLAYVFKTRKRL